MATLGESPAGVSLGVSLVDWFSFRDSIAIVPDCSLDFHGDVAAYPEAYPQSKEFDSIHLPRIPRYAFAK